MRKPSFGTFLAIAAAITFGAFVRPSPAAPVMKDDPAMNNAPGRTTPGRPASPGAPAARPPGVAAPTAKPVARKPIPWIEDFRIAQRRAQKEEKPIMLYFCASDWDDFTMKLEEEVMNTSMWGDWASQNMLLVKIDYPKNDKKQSAQIKQQNGELKTRFNIAKVPTFIFLDPWGDLLGRVGYTQASLKDHEPKDEPRSWLQYCQAVVASRPMKEKLTPSTDLTAAVTAVRKTAIPLCILITQTKNNQVATALTQTLLQNQLFVRFINRNMGFVHIEWPEETDVTPRAKDVREFAAKWKFGPSACRLVIWSPGGLGELKDQFSITDALDCGPLVKRLERLLPTIDYNGGWIEDWKAARALAAQQQKDLFVSFINSDKNFSQLMHSEIYDTKEFMEYAKKNLILLKVDFPDDAAKQAKQSKELKEQNRLLAEMYGIRGYPTVVVLNPKGQKIIDIPKYMKGGATLFIAELKKQIMKDRDRRTLISQEAAKDVEQAR